MTINLIKKDGLVHLFFQFFNSSRECRNICFHTNLSTFPCCPVRASSQAPLDSFTNIKKDWIEAEERFYRVDVQFSNGVFYLFYNLQSSFFQIFTRASRFLLSFKYDIMTLRHYDITTLRHYDITTLRHRVVYLFCQLIIQFFLKYF